MGEWDLSLIHDDTRCMDSLRLVENIMGVAVIRTPPAVRFLLRVVGALTSIHDF